MLLAADIRQHDDPSKGWDFDVRVRLDGVTLRLHLDMCRSLKRHTWAMECLAATYSEARAAGWNGLLYLGIAEVAGSVVYSDLMANLSDEEKLAADFFEHPVGLRFFHIRRTLALLHL